MRSPPPMQRIRVRGIPLNWNFSDIRCARKKKKSIVSIAREKEERNERKKDRRRDCCSPRFLVQRKLGDSLPPRDDPLGARRPWAGTDPRAWRRIGRVLWRSCPRGPGDSSCTCADNSARRPRRSIPASQPGSPRLRASSATGGTSSPSGTSGSKGPGRPATRAPAWSRSESLGRPIRTIFAGPGTVGNKKENSFSLLPCSRWFADPLFFFEREGTIFPGYRTLPSRTSTSKLLGQSGRKIVINNHCKPCSDRWTHGWTNYWDTRVGTQLPKKTNRQLVRLISRNYWFLGYLWERRS